MFSAGRWDQGIKILSRWLSVAEITGHRTLAVRTNSKDLVSWAKAEWVAAWYSRTSPLVTRERTRFMASKWHSTLATPMAFSLDQDVILLVHLAPCLQHGIRNRPDLGLEVAEVLLQLGTLVPLLDQVHRLLEAARSLHSMDVVGQDFFDEAAAEGRDLLHVGGPHGHDFVFSFKWPAIGASSGAGGLWCSWQKSDPAR